MSLFGLDLYAAVHFLLLGGTFLHGVVQKDISFFLIPISILFLDTGHPMTLSCVINFLIDFSFFFSYFIAYGCKHPTFVQSCTRCF